MRSDLARDLGVSRTPLREAIARLEREDTLVVVPRVGAFVKPLTAEEFEQIYPIRALLDPEALRLAGLPSGQHIDRLERLNARIDAAADPDAIIALDDEWHLLLIQGCANEVFDRSHPEIHASDAAIRAGPDARAKAGRRRERYTQRNHRLRRGELERAAGILKHNLETGGEPIRRWLVEREARS